MKKLLTTELMGLLVFDNKAALNGKPCRRVKINGNTYYLDVEAFEMMQGDWGLCLTSYLPVSQMRQIVGDDFKGWLIGLAGMEVEHCGEVPDWHTKHKQASKKLYLTTELMDLCDELENDEHLKGVCILDGEILVADVVKPEHSFELMIQELMNECVFVSAVIVDNTLMISSKNLVKNVAVFQLKQEENFDEVIAVGCNESDLGVLAMADRAYVLKGSAISGKHVEDGRFTDGIRDVLEKESLVKS